MREIKFRYRFENIHTGERLTATFPLGLIEHRGFTPDVFGLEWTMLSRDEFIGKHDSKGKEIYEGDLCKDSTGVSIIKWDDRFASFCLTRNGWVFKHFFGEAVEAEETEVIGNIYENPELVKSKEEAVG